MRAGSVDTVRLSSVAAPPRASRPKGSPDRVTLGNELPPPNPGAGVFADPFGKITHLALQLDSEATDHVRDNVLNAWMTLFRTMDPDVRFTVVLEREQDREAVEGLLASAGIAAPERFQFLVTKDLDITLWSRDQMVGLFSTDERTTLLGQTTMRPHGDDPHLPPRIAEANPTTILLDPDKRLVTDGGDEVSNSRETFLGYNSLYLTAQKLYEESGQAVPGVSPFRHTLKTLWPEGLRAPDFRYEPNPFFSPSAGLPDERYWLDQAQRLFEEKFGKPVTVVGADDPATPEREEPATFHIDMGLTPVDDRTMLVGDPSMALDLIRGLSREDYDDYNRRLAVALGFEGDHLAALVEENTTKNPLLQHQFEKNAELMRSKGYEVVRVPYLQGPWDLPWVTYNNCLQETFTREDGTLVRRAFLPVYGLPALDAKAREAYEAQGFEVVPLELPALTSWRGAIRCISNILGRSPEA